MNKEQLLAKCEALLGDYMNQPDFDPEIVNGFKAFMRTLEAMQ